jgi:hypothetical protein
MPERSSDESTAEYRATDGSRRGRVLLPITLVVAIAAAALSGWMLVRLAQEGTPKTPNYSAAQSADAKQKICTAAGLVRKGVSLNTNLQPIHPTQLDGQHQQLRRQDRIPQPRLLVYSSEHDGLNPF